MNRILTETYELRMSDSHCGSISPPSSYRSGDDMCSLRPSQGDIRRPRIRFAVHCSLSASLVEFSVTIHGVQYMRSSLLASSISTAVLAASIPHQRRSLGPRRYSQVSSTTTLFSSQPNTNRKPAHPLLSVPLSLLTSQLEHALRNHHCRPCPRLRHNRRGSGCRSNPRELELRWFVGGRMRPAGLDVLRRQRRARARVLRRLPLPLGPGLAGRSESLRLTCA